MPREGKPHGKGIPKGRSPGRHGEEFGSRARGSRGKKRHPFLAAVDRLEAGRGLSPSQLETVRGIALSVFESRDQRLPAEEVLVRHGVRDRRRQKEVLTVLNDLGLLKKAHGHLTIPEWHRE